MNILNPSLEVPPLLVVVLVDPLCVSVAAVMSLEGCGMGLEVLRMSIVGCLLV